MIIITAIQINMTISPARSLIIDLEKMFPSASRRYMKPGIGLGCSTVKVTAWLWIGCTVATLVTSQQNFYTNGRYGKRWDPREASSFWSGSRYGRSGDSGSSATMNKEEIDTGAKDVEVSPRLDRFFLGSRYGKRTVTNDQRIDSLKHFETSLDFLISVDHLQANDKEQLKILNQELNDKGNFVGKKSEDNDFKLTKNYGSFLENAFACLYTGVANLYRCFHRKSNGSQGSPN